MSPRTKKQFEEIREEKKALIMDVALEQFAVTGFHATTISHIARHAGISKGLMYNYFRSKEELLVEIIKRSVTEIYSHFDPNHDGYLTEDEFEFFVRKISSLIRDKRMIWRLFFQMMMQNEVREFLKKSGLFSFSSVSGTDVISEKNFMPGVIKMMGDYFLRKSKGKAGSYDPRLEMDMFIMTLKGLAVTYIFMDSGEDEKSFNRTVDSIIAIYK
jgi:AcrR family transcriptional regulator